MRIGTTNIIDITNNNSLDATTSPVSQLLTVAKPDHLSGTYPPVYHLTFEPAHNAERIILTSNIILAVRNLPRQPPA